jgi:hypothetical protein
MQKLETPKPPLHARVSQIHATCTNIMESIPHNNGLQLAKVSRISMKALEAAITFKLLFEVQ